MRPSPIPEKENALPARPTSRRDWTGYTPGMMLAEFCLLRRVIAQTVQENLLAVNLSYWCRISPVSTKVWMNRQKSH